MRTIFFAIQQNFPYRKLTPAYCKPRGSRIWTAPTERECIRARAASGVALSHLGRRGAFVHAVAVNVVEAFVVVAALRHRAPRRLDGAVRVRRR